MASGHNDLLNSECRPFVMANGRQLPPLGRADRWAYAYELVERQGLSIGEALEVVTRRYQRGFYHRLPQLGRGDVNKLLAQGLLPTVGTVMALTSSRGQGETDVSVPQPISGPRSGEGAFVQSLQNERSCFADAESEVREPSVEMLVTLAPEAQDDTLPPCDLLEPKDRALGKIDFAAPSNEIADGYENGGLGRAVKWRRYLEESGIFDSMPEGATGGENSVAPRAGAGAQRSEPEVQYLPREVAKRQEIELDMSSENKESFSGFPGEGPSMNSSETIVKSPTPSGHQVEEEWNERMMKERRERAEVWGVPRVILVLCSLFWKLEILQICDLLQGSEAPPNDDDFCRRTVESVFRNHGRSGELLAAESRMTIHAIDVMKQSEDQIVHAIEKYMRRYTHVIMIPNSFHFWELMERQLGGLTPVYMKEITNRYVQLGSRLMRQGLAREVLMLPFLPMGEPTCELVPRVNLANVWNALVDHCNQANDYVMIIATHMWTLEMAKRSMNVPNIVSWNFIPHDSRQAWEVYVNHFTDRYERRRPVVLRCGLVHCTGSHYLLHELWGLVQDTAPVCECEMTVSVVRPLSRRQKRKFNAILRS